MEVPATETPKIRLPDWFLFLLFLVFVLLVWAIMQPAVGSRPATKEASANMDINMIAGGLEEYRKDVGVYPPILAELWTAPSDAERKKLWKGPYYEPRGPTPLDPWRTPYQYRTDAEQFRVSTNGGDGVADTQDDIGFDGKTLTGFGTE